MIRVEDRDAVAVITIDRPDKKGALNLEMRLQLADLVEKLSFDPEVLGIVLTGTPGVFCSGGDVSGMGKRTLQSGRAILQRSSQRIIRTLYRADKPVIAAVDGPAAGIGWSLALACDHVIATSRAKFSMAFAKLGLVPDGAGVFLMKERIGAHATKQLVSRAATLTVEEALAKGLVDAMAQPDNILDEAVATAHDWATTSPFAFALAKQLVASATGTLEDYLRAELLAVPQPLVSDEHKKAIEAFLQKKS